jgi:hypothetical protein
VTHARLAAAAVLAMDCTYDVLEDSGENLRAVDVYREATA